MEENMVTFNEFKKLEIKIAKIKEVNNHPNADKLYVMKIDAGSGEKTIVAGIKNNYPPGQLVNRQIVVVDNLEPVTIRGVESQAMLLAASDEKGISILVPDREVQTGSLIK
jgi:methionyl-tRNA synthetase